MLESLADWELLWHRRMLCGFIAVIHISLKLIVVGYVAEFPQCGFDRRDNIHVLKISTHTFEFHGGPDQKLGHTTGVVAPLL